MVPARIPCHGTMGKFRSDLAMASFATVSSDGLIVVFGIMSRNWCPKSRCRRGVGGWLAVEGSEMVKIRKRWQPCSSCEDVLSSETSLCPSYIHKGLCDSSDVKANTIVKHVEFQNIFCLIL